MFYFQLVKMLLWYFSNPCDVFLTQAIVQINGMGTVLRQLNIMDKENMLSLVESIEMFDKQEVAYVRKTFEANQDMAIWIGSFDEQGMNGIAYSMPVEMTNNTWNVLMLLVHPEHQRKGVGKSLMRMMEDTLINRSQRLLIVETSSTDDFEFARNFYHAIGYSQQGTIEHFYDDDDHKVTFIKKLN